MKNSCLILALICCLTTNVFSQFINVDIEPSNGSNIIIAPGVPININYNIAGTPPFHPLTQPSFGINIQIEIYNVLNLVTPVWTSSTYPAIWSSPIGSSTVWFGPSL